MKIITKFTDFILNEEEKKKEDFKHLPRLKSVVDKEFFMELKSHIYYWFNFDSLKDEWILTSLENDENEVVVWFNDNKDEPTIEVKVLYTSIGDDPKVEKIETVKMMISIYDFNNQELLKETEMEVGLKYLNAKSFSNFIEKVQKRILKTPKDGDDIEDFKKKEKRRLGDNIY